MPTKCHKNRDKAARNLQNDLASFQFVQNGNLPASLTPPMTTDILLDEFKKSVADWQSWASPIFLTPTQLSTKFAVFPSMSLNPSPLLCLYIFLP